ncbi:MAG: DUF302 domain-containing protein [Bacteroidia bacterium]|nr:DUF302 domain-containing protein [Bacteroidia bacterium]
MKTNEMFIEFESKFGYTETIEKLTETILANEWKMPAVHDLQEILKKSGKDVLPIKVLELCKSKYSSQLLEKDELRNVSTLMPCRISAYEKDNGKTYISLMNADLLAKQIGGKVEEVMAQAYSEIEKIVEGFRK